RQVSFYHHRYRNEKAPPSFASFMHEDARARIDNFDIYSLDGDVAVDFVGRYESLADDLKLALGHVGLSLEAELPRAKTTFRRNALPYRDYYDDDTRGIVARWYAREIELLNYEFWVSGVSRMIISHEHKFIFLKTKKTAGNAIEAALSELCGPDCVITPYREESEEDRKGRPPQNYRIEHPLKPKR